MIGQKSWMLCDGMPPLLNDWLKNLLKFGGMYHDNRKRLEIRMH